MGTAQEEYKRQMEIYSAQKVDLPLQEATTPPEAHKRKGDPTQQGQSKRGRQNKTLGKEGVEFSEEVLAKARAAGYEAQFLKMAWDFIRVRPGRVVCQRETLVITAHAGGYLAPSKLFFRLRGDCR